MDPIIILESEDLTVEPGGRTQVAVRLRNPSHIVEAFDLDVVGESASWAEVVPAKLSVYPQEEEVAQVVFSPPVGSSTPAGAFPFGVRAVSQVDRTRSAVAEGDIEVGGVASVSAKLTPVASSGRWSGRHLVQLSNWGNAPVRLELDVSDPDEKLGFLLQKTAVDLPIGATETIALRVRTRRPVLRGATARLPFSVRTRPAADGVALPDVDPSHPTVEGAFEQRPILTQSVVKFAAIGVVLLAAAAYLGLRDPGTDSRRPVAPTELGVTMVALDEAKLTWKPVPGAESYTAFHVEPDGGGDIDTTEGIPGTEKEQNLEGIKTRDKYCFQMVTVRGDQTSQRSEPACGELSYLPPAEVKMKESGGNVTITWADQTEGKASFVILRNGTDLEQVEAGETEWNGELTGGKDCFAVRADSGSNESAVVEAGCVGGDGPPTPSDLQWIAIVKAYQVETDPVAEATKEGLVDLTADLKEEMAEHGVAELEYLSTKDYAVLKDRYPVDYYVIYARFKTEGAAEAFSDDRYAVVEPGKPNE